MFESNREGTRKKKKKNSNKPIQKLGINLVESDIRLAYCMGPKYSDSSIKVKFSAMYFK